MLEDGDENENEPEPDGRQFDAVTRFEEPEGPDPHSLGPSVPRAGEDTHPRVRFLFWGLVVVFNLAVLGVGVGLLMLVFTDDAVLALQVLAAGLLVLAYGLYRYRGAKREVATLTGDGKKG